MSPSPRRPTLDLSVEQITPKIAKEWLESNVHNRKLSERLVDTYAETMAAGEWVLNGEPIIFDRDGKLQSGQHRLWAVIASGTTIHSVIVRGADPLGLFSLDTGRKRRVTDALTLQGESDVAVLGNALNWLWRYSAGLMDMPGITSTTTHLLRVLEENPDIREFVRLSHRVRGKVPIPTGMIAALMFVFTNINAKEAEAFYELLVTGENLDSKHPVFALRRWLTRTKLESKRPTQRLVAAITIKAWNAYRRHEDVASLRWAANEAFPVAE